MLEIQRSFIAIVFVVSFIFVFSPVVNAQVLSGTYLFLEAVDSNQKPVLDAKVEIDAGNLQQIKYTDAWGECKFWFRKDIMPPFTITKPDYYPFYDFNIFRYREVRNIKVELLKIPITKSERETPVDEQSKREFFWAIRKGDVQSVRKFIKSGISPNLTIGNLRGVSGYENIPAVIYPAMTGDGAMLKLLLKAGADVRRKDEYLSSILFYYLQSNGLGNRQFTNDGEKAKILHDYDEGLKDLIKAGVDVNAVESAKLALIQAIEKGWVFAVKTLIENEAKVNPPNYTGKSPLTMAREYLGSSYYPQSKTDYQKIIKLLEAAGAK